MDFVAGTAIAFPVTFSVRGQPAVPDTGSVTYTLYDNNGAAVSGHTDAAVSLPAAATTVLLNIPGTVNAITKRFEKRRIRVKFLRGGATQFLDFSYRLLPMLNHNISQADVRAYIGVNASELPDEEIDIFAAYLDVEEVITQTTLNTALVSGTKAELTANNAIKWQAALNIMPSLQLRVAQTETNGVLSFTRPVIKDFSKLIEDTQARLSEALDSIGTRTEIAVPLMVVAQPVDSITGA